MKNSAAERQGIFGREEKTLRAFLILHRAAPPTLARENHSANNIRDAQGKTEGL
jgi:hypothetical protein